MILWCILFANCLQLQCTIILGPNEGNYYKRKLKFDNMSHLLTPDGSHVFSNDRMVVGVAWHHGARPYMQDAFVVGLNAGVDVAPDLFGVFDGHGENGENVARYAAKNIGNMIADIYEANGKKEFEDCCQKACVRLDDDIRYNKNLMNEIGEVTGGTTCNIIFVGDKMLYSINLGDSRALVASGGKAVAISRDHNPQSPEEFFRIRRAGGIVSNQRVNGRIAVSRALGDFFYKALDRPAGEQLISSVPDVREMPLDKGVEFIVVATDGVWDLLTNQAAVDFIIKRMDQQLALEEICEELVTECGLRISEGSGIGSDNVTMIVAIPRPNG